MLKGDGHPAALGFVQAVGLSGFDRLVDDVIDADAFRCVDIVFAEGKRKPIDEIGGPSAAPEDVLHAVLYFGLLRDGFDQLCLQKHARQKIVQVVADSIRNLAKHARVLTTNVLAEFLAQPLKFGSELLYFLS